SFWGAVFKDDQVRGKRVSHAERGILSMANRGPDTNGSQFFILFRPAKHLDGKHTVFGRVVGGLDVLAKMEAVPTDDSDRPVNDIVIQNSSVLVDPYDEFSRRLERKIEHDKRSAELAAGKRKRTADEEDELERETMTWFGTKAAAARVNPDAKLALRNSEEEKETSVSGGNKEPSGQAGVGKYLKKPRFEATSHQQDSMSADDDDDSERKRKKRAAIGYSFGDFSNW
ncbi:cyclophilin peptidyl-prolyl cis-trans isomerase Cyp8, partial [Coemansia sp. RSA 1933]